MTRYTYCPLCATKLVEQRIEHSLKQSCNRPECSFVHWENPTPVVLLLVELNEHYIVTHNLAWPKWKYSLISGFVDARESPEQTAVREIKEELNLETLSLQLITVSLYAKLNQLMISYLAKTTGEIQLNHEHDDYKLLSAEEIAHWNFGSGSIPTIEKWLSWQKQAATMDP